MPIGNKEFLFSYMLRYHKYLGYDKFSDTCNEAFECVRNHLHILFPANVSTVLNALNISRDDYLSNHSAMRFFQAFTTKEKYDIAYTAMFEQGINYFNLIRLASRQTIVSPYLFYCPECLKEHMKYESITAAQQILEVNVCPKHCCKLKRIHVRDPRLLLDLSEWDYNTEFCEPNSVDFDIAKDVTYIIENSVELNLTLLRELILYGEFDCYLSKKKPGEAFKEIPWKDYYDRLPEKYEKYKERACFERFDGRMDIKNIDPVEYLIFIRSVFGSFKELYEKYK